MIFEDAEEVHFMIKEISDAYNILIQKIPELQRMSDSELTETIQVAFELVEDNMDSIAPCTDPSCAESVAIAAVFCLPSLLGAGWGYFICMAGAATGAMYCCYG
jgi:hypothetical protein